MYYYISIFTRALKNIFSEYSSFLEELKILKSQKH